MITIQEKFDDNILALKVTNKLSEEDLDEFIPQLKEYIASSDHPHLFMILDDFGGYESASAFMKDLKLETEYIGSFDRVAVVGDKEWEKWVIQVMDPITREELKFFSFDEKEQAQDWITTIPHPQ